MANIEILSQNTILPPPPFNTLAQPRNSVSNLHKRARSKWYTQQLALLMKYTVEKDDLLYKYYSHAANCCQLMTQNGQKICTRYCNSRLCNVCNRIRTAKMMNAYISQMTKFEYIEFVTLTVVNVKEQDMKSIYAKMLKSWSQIVDVYRKKGIQLNGLRKMEWTYNDRRDDYHPHFHILVEGHYGEEIIDEWLKRFPTSRRSGQDCRMATTDSLNEIFKYTTKIYTKDTITRSKFIVFARALNNILHTMYGKRSIQTFGSIRKASEDVYDDLHCEEYDVPEYEFMEWIWEDCDWVDMPTRKKTLTGYVNPEIEIVLIE